MKRRRRRGGGGERIEAKRRGKAKHKSSNKECMKTSLQSNAEQEMKHTFCFPNHAFQLEDVKSQFSELRNISSECLYFIIEMHVSPPKCRVRYHLPDPPTLDNEAEFCRKTRIAFFRFGCDSGKNGFLTAVQLRNQSSLGLIDPFITNRSQKSISKFRKPSLPPTTQPAYRAHNSCAVCDVYMHLA